MRGSAREEPRKRQLTLAHHKKINRGNRLENSSAPSCGDRTARHDRNVQNAPGQLGNALEFVLKQADAADTDDVGAIVEQLRHEFFVRTGVERSFKDFNVYIGIVPPRTTGHVHESNGRDVNLGRNQPADPAPLIVGLDQQNPAALRQLRQKVAWRLLR